MPFAFGAADFLQVLKLCQYVYGALKSGPEKYKEIQSELKSLSYAISLLQDDAKDPRSILNRKGESRKQDLSDIMDNCARALQDLESLVEKHSKLQNAEAGRLVRMWDAYQVGSTDLDSIRGRLTFHVSTINTFLTSLEGSTLSRMERKLDKIYAKITQDATANSSRRVSALSNESSELISLLSSRAETQEDNIWERLREELSAEDISQAHILAHREEIMTYMRSLVQRSTLSTREPMDDVMVSDSLRALSLEKRDSLPKKLLPKLPGQSPGRDRRTSEEDPFSDAESLDPSRRPSTSLDISSLRTDRQSTGLLYSQNIVGGPTESLRNSLQSAPVPSGPELIPREIGKWSDGQAHIVVFLTAQKYGIYNERPGCCLLLDVHFKAPAPSADRLEPREFRTADVHCTVHPSGAGTGSEFIKVIPRSGIRVPGSDKHDHVRPRGIFSTIASRKPKSSWLQNWTMSGWVGHECRRANWSIHSNGESAQGIPKHALLGMIVQHVNQPFHVEIEVVASTLGADGMLGDIVGPEPTLIPIDPVKSQELLNDKSLYALKERTPMIIWNHLSCRGRIDDLNEIHGHLHCRNQ
ncbi:uncharacterized protein KY384_009256, partial [Bacidia gigantensis]|uniref:uncharacterized protein n=1 Tax=Bacidia gigantensis TaxID=2732470 RepID=UPI001D03FC21